MENLWIFAAHWKVIMERKIWGPIDLVIYLATQTPICEQGHTSEQMATNILGGLTWNPDF